MAEKAINRKENGIINHSFRLYMSFLLLEKMVKKRTKENVKD